MAMPSLCPEVFYVKMINTQLAAQFITHMSVSFMRVFVGISLCYLSVVPFCLAGFIRE